jgi:DNA-binding NtrC family response regulator
VVGHAFIGRSEEIVSLREIALQVAAKDVSVLITGETGTGKEVLARFIYERSWRAGRPLVAINCAALAQGLVESELFGHEKGAFTGAHAAHAGCFEQAQSGTLFLDEVTEIPPSTQAKLLRVLQEREIRRVGGVRATPVDVRIIAASSRDVQRAIAEGTLREDLYYRLSTVELALPALRERPEDILPISEHLLAKHASRNDSQLAALSREAAELMRAYPWPGNIRELENVIARATALAQAGDGTLLLPEHLPPKLHGAPAAATASEPSSGAAGAPAEEGLVLEFSVAMARLKQRYAEEALRRAAGNKAAAARLLGVSRRGFYNLLRGT